VTKVANCNGALSGEDVSLGSVSLALGDVDHDGANELVVGMGRTMGYLTRRVGSVKLHGRHSYLFALDR